MVTKDEIAAAHKYFSKAEGIRIGKFMSELRYQFIMRYTEAGMSPKQIFRITKISHDKQHYYRTTYCSDGGCNEDIKQNMLEWMYAGLYPISNYSGGNTVVGYVLSENPGYKHVREKKHVYRNNVEFEKLLDQLNI